jgi:hypothetical protein
MPERVIPSALAIRSTVWKVTFLSPRSIGLTLVWCSQTRKAYSQEEFVFYEGQSSPRRAPLRTRLAEFDNKVQDTNQNATFLCGPFTKELLQALNP